LAWAARNAFEQDLQDYGVSKDAGKLLASETRASSPLALLDLLLGLAAGALWYVLPAVGPWPLILVAVGFLARLACLPRLRWRLGALDLPLALFLASAGMGLALSYNHVDALAKFWVIVGGVAIYGSVLRSTDRVPLARSATIQPLRVLLALFPAIVAGYFLLTTDWSRWMGKLPPLDALMRWVASWQPQLPGHRLHPNVAGGLIAAFIPLQVAAVGGSPLGILLIALSFAGLLLTASRGAWLALGVTTASWLLWLAANRWRSRQAAASGARPLSWPMFASVTVVASLSLAGLLAAGVPVAVALSPVADRANVLGNSLALAFDTPFTGIGLESFQMAFSSYVLLLHVGHTYHSHNLVLNVWIEQGLPGLIALLWLLAAAVGLGRRATRWNVAALAAIAVIVMHGMVDDAFYGSRGVLAFLIPFALLARGEGVPVQAAALALASADEARPARQRRGLLTLAGVLVLVLTVSLLPSVRAAFQANLGALSQTRAELSVYRWPEWPIQDALRVDPAVDLGPAIARYRAALALDPANVTANRRLAQIALARGDEAAARAELALAIGAAPGQRANRQLMGESYAISGQVEQAADLWRTIIMNSGQVDTRAWWYDHVGSKQKADWIRAAGKLAGW
jgi:hypothetical protein